jgi:hypothetical protein
MARVGSISITDEWPARLCIDENFPGTFHEGGRGSVRRGWRRPGQIRDDRERRLSADRIWPDDLLERDKTCK